MNINKENVTMCIEDFKEFVLILLSRYSLEEIESALSGFINSLNKEEIENYE